MTAYGRRSRGQGGDPLQTIDLDDRSLLPLFLSCRAAVRAKTSATEWQPVDASVHMRIVEGLADKLVKALR